MTIESKHLLLMIGQKKHKLILIQYKFKVSTDSSTTTTQLQSHSSTGESDPWSKSPMLNKHKYKEWYLQYLLMTYTHDTCTLDNFRKAIEFLKGSCKESDF